MPTKIVILKFPSGLLRSIPSTPSGKAGQNGSPVGTPEPKSKSKPKKKPVKQQGSVVGAPASPHPDETGTPVKAAPKASTTAAKTLDRSGKPCKKWTKQPINLTSFTGVKFEIPGWMAKEDKPGLESVKEESAGEAEPVAV
jgi:hypothetical protein